MTETASIRIRRIEPGDDRQIAQVIRSTMMEYGATGPGHSIHDPEVDTMSAAYGDTRSAYWVLDRGGTLIGGGGVGPLKGGDGDTCELRKMYFLPEARGQGLGRRLASEILAFATRAGYRRIYLETMQSMAQARALYERLGFTRGKPRGATGHFGCDAWYEKELGEGGEKGESDARRGEQGG